MVNITGIMYSSGNLGNIGILGLSSPVSILVFDFHLVVKENNR
jgi:hypothetical protein